MIKCFKSLLVVVFPLLTLLTGCNSEGAFNSEPQPPVDAVVVEITVTPSPISVLENRTQQLVAMAKFDDGTESDITGSATWSIVGDPTIAEISASGLVTGTTRGDTELTATKDGITSNTVTVNVCTTADACLDIFDTGTGKLFTNSPSVAYLDSIGGSPTNGTYNENGAYGPAGDFYVFNWVNANALCDTYNNKSISGRTNWRLATRDELKVELFDTYNNMYAARGWPTRDTYWSMTANGPLYDSVHLYFGSVNSFVDSSTDSASCVSSNP
ncbi:Ig-like domain-containing protein [Vibrio cholerae]|uniref:Ig-like domain-containing protein n=1 Tax=Vibrio cholerae TaxID=666 RepID=UPI003DA0C1C8